MLDKKLLLSYISHPELLGVDDLILLERAVAKYPCSQILRMLYLKALYNSGDFSYEQRLAQNAVFLTDRQAMFELINATQIQPIKQQILSEGVEEIESAKELDQWIDEQRQDVCGVDALIDRFIQTNPRIKPSANSTFASYANGNQRSEPIGIMTETLARIYVEQKKYDQAIEAYQILMLGSPHKKEYFAQQIDKIHKSRE